MQPDITNCNHEENNQYEALLENNERVTTASLNERDNELNAGMLVNNEFFSIWLKW